MTENAPKKAGRVAELENERLRKRLIEQEMVLRSEAEDRENILNRVAQVAIGLAELDSLYGDEQGGTAYIGKAAQLFEILENYASDDIVQEVGAYIPDIRE